MPEPYYERGGITIYHGDCREILPLLGRGIADLIIADPCYGETSLDWDRWLTEWPGEVLPFVKPTGSMWCFGSLRMFMDHAAEFSEWRLAQDVVWEKHNGSSFHADRFKRVHESVAHFYPRSTPWGQVYKAPQYTNDATARTLRRKQRPPHTGHIEAGIYTSQDGGPRLMRSVVYARSCHGRAVNETQKPEATVAADSPHVHTLDYKVYHATGGLTLVRPPRSARFAENSRPQPLVCWQVTC